MRTSKRLFASVDSQVFSQITLMLKSLTADFALKRFFIGVGSHVGSQHVLHSTCVVTETTLIRLLATVDAKVHSQSTLLPKSLGTDFTLEGFYIGVYQHVVFEMRLLSELFRADTALVRHLYLLLLSTTIGSCLSFWHCFVNSIALLSASSGRWGYYLNDNLLFFEDLCLVAAG